MKFFSNLFTKQPVTETEILNSGLKLAMEFGKNWLQPIQNRLLKKYNFLTTEEVDKYNLICKEVMRNGNAFIYDTLSNLTEKEATIKRRELKNQCDNFILEKYPWISKSNLSRLFNQECYYAGKDGYYECVR